MSTVKVRARKRQSRSGFDALSTEQLLALHERHFGLLDRQSKRRIVQTARTHGWDRSWDVDGLTL